MNSLFVLLQVEGSYHFLLEQIVLLDQQICIFYLLLSPDKGFLSFFSLLTLAFSTFNFYKYLQHCLRKFSLLLLLSYTLLFFTSLKELHFCVVIDIHINLLVCFVVHLQDILVVPTLCATSLRILSHRLPPSWYKFLTVILIKTCSSF